MSYRKYRFFYPLLGCLITAGYTPVLSQQLSLTPKAVLNTAFQDLAYQQSNQKLLTTEQLRFHVPIVSKVEARLGLNGTAWRDTIYGNLRNEDFYGLTLGLNSLQLIKAQKSVKTAQINVFKAENQYKLQTALFERYQLLAGWVGTERRLQAETALLKRLNQKKQLLGLMLEQGLEVRVKDVIQTEADRSNAEVNIKAFESALNTYRGVLKGWLRDTLTDVAIDCDSLKLPTLNMIDSLVKTNPEIAYNDANIAVQKAKVGLEEAQLYLKTRDNRQIFNQFQVGYQNPIGQTEVPKNKRFNNNYSVRFSLALPLPGNNNFKRSEQILAQLKANDDWRVADRQQILLHQSQHHKLTGKIRELQSLEQKWAESLIPKMLNNPKLTAQISALELLELAIETEKHQVEAAKIWAGILIEYANWIHFSGRTAQMPLVNYFSSQLDDF